jgi:glutamyl-tRNA reductase
MRCCARRSPSADVRKETALGSHLVSAPHAAVELAEQIFGSLAKRNIVLLGAGKMGTRACKALVSRGAHSVFVVDGTDARAEELARRFGIRSCAFADRWTDLAQADLVISATTAPGFVFTSEDMRRLASDRKGRKLLLIDLALPRDIDPAVRKLEGVLLYDLEDLERAVEPRSSPRAGEREAEQIVLAEVQGFRQELMADHAASELTALRLRLDEICRQELESFRLEQGPFPKDQDQLIAAVSARITHKIAGSLAKEWKGHPEPRKHGHASAAV